MYDDETDSYYGQVHAPLGHIMLITDQFQPGPGVAARVALHTAAQFKDYFRRKENKKTYVRNRR